jgi:hypothetical protein
MENLCQGHGDVNYSPCIDLTQGYAAPEQQQLPPFEVVLNFSSAIHVLLYRFSSLISVLLKACIKKIAIS